MSGFELKTLVVIGTDFKGSCTSNYHTITTTTSPPNISTDLELSLFVIIISVSIMGLTSTAIYTRMLKL